MTINTDMMLLLILFIITIIYIFIYIYCDLCSEKFVSLDIDSSYKDYKDMFKKNLDSVEYSDNNLKKNQIFVSIASYRDPEILRTVTNLINNSKYPKNIWIHIYEQNGTNDKSVSGLPQLLLDKSNVILETVPYENAMGPNWARYLIQKKWDNEEYYLQIDSHTMFDKNWDTRLIKMLKELPDLSVLTQYPPEYDLVTGKYDTKILRSGLYVEGIKVNDHFTRIQSEYHIGKPPNKPFKSQAWGACFSFSKSNILRDAPYDPYLFYLFFGEELDITLRLYTRGWTFWSPNESIVFTCFKRDHRKTIWGDHDKEKRKNIELLARTRLYYKFGFNDQIKFILNKSFNKSFKLILKDIEKFNLGTVRSLGDYEDFSGIDLKNRTVKGNNRKKIININRQKQLDLNNIKLWELIF
jgi:hypothetical protein